MIPIYIVGKTLDDTYFQLLSSIDKHGRRYKITSGSYEGSERIEFDRVSGVIEYPATRPLSPERSP